VPRRTLLVREVLVQSHGVYAGTVSALHGVPGYSIARPVDLYGPVPLSGRLCAGVLGTVWPFHVAFTVYHSHWFLICR